MKVNGDVVELEECCSLYEFVMAQGYDLKLIAVERNQEIVPKDSYQKIMLQDDDVLEVVSFVGGG